MSRDESADAHVSDAQRCITEGLPVAASTVRGLLARLATAEAEKEALRVEFDAKARDYLDTVRLLQDRTEAAEAALAGLVAAVEALADASLRDGRGGTWVHDAWFRALLTADHAAALRAREAKVLLEAADDVGPALQSEVGGHTSTRSVRQWLRHRAESIEKGE